MQLELDDNTFDLKTTGLKTVKDVELPEMIAIDFVEMHFIVRGLIDDNEATEIENPLQFYEKLHNVVKERFQLIMSVGQLDQFVTGVEQQFDIYKKKRDGLPMLDSGSTATSET